MATSPRIHTPLRLTAARLRASALCFVGWLIAGAAWVFGARFTIDGVLVGTNWLLRFVSAPLQLGAPAWWGYALLIPLPLWFSSIEWGDNPVQLVEREGWTLALAGSVCVWLIVVGADVFTTLLGLSAYDAGTSTVLAFALDTLVGVLAATAFFTFWPEWLARMMLARWRVIWRA